MHRRRVHLVVAILVMSVATALGYWNRTGGGVDMTKTAEVFLKSLNDTQRGVATMPYDAPQRTDWHYIPKPTRKGLQVKDMDETQRSGALALLSSSLSAVGYGKATKIMELESLLHELEKSKTGAPLRDPLRYYFTVFGTPKADGRWGLSVEGHHLSLNFVVDNNKVISSTPTFFGANPALVQADYGPQFKKGLRVLGKEEELAFQLLGSLTSEQRKAAVMADKAPNDIRGAGAAVPPLSPAVGLAASEMTSDQQATLKALVEEYANNLPPEVARERLAKIEQHGYGNLKFSWQGADKPDVGHDYRIQGATFLIEFNNTQPDSAGNLANHIHCAWHDLAGNFAIPVAK